MTTVEYRVEYVHFDTDANSGSINAQLVARLNEWARDGWRVATVDLTPHPEFGPRSRPVLLERDAPIGGTQSPAEPSRVESLAR
jgi:hypothetical protein